MPLTDFEVQKKFPSDYKDLEEWRNASVQGEVDLRNAQIEGLQAHVSEVTGDRDKCKARADELLAFVTKCDQAIKGGASLDEVRNILEPLIEVQLTPEIEKEISQLREEEAKYQSIIADIEAKIAELQK